MSFTCVYCRGTFNHSGIRNLHQWKCGYTAARKRSHKADDRADTEEPISKIRKYSAAGVVYEDWGFTDENYVADAESLADDDSVAVDESVADDESIESIADDESVQRCDQSLFIYQKTVERMFRDGLEIIQNDAFSTKVKTTSGKYDTGNRKIFLSMVMYCSESHKLSSHDCDELIDMIKYITREHGTEIPLPSRYVLYLERAIVQLLIACY